MNDDNQKYIKEMEKNSKIFEEKMNKFKKYKKSLMYNELDDDYEEDYYGLDENKYSAAKRLQDIEDKENPEDKYNYDVQKNDELSPNNSMKKKIKKREEDNYNDFMEDNILDLDDDYGNNKNYYIKGQKRNSINFYN